MDRIRILFDIPIFDKGTPEGREKLYDAIVRRYAQLLSENLVITPGMEVEIKWKIIF